MTGLQTLRTKKFVKNTSHEILDGVYLTLTAAPPVWQTYIRLNEKTYRKSTGKRDLNQTKMTALGLFYDVQRHKDDQSKPSVFTFDKLSEVYKTHVEK